MFQYRPAAAEPVKKSIRIGGASCLLAGLLFAGLGWFAYSTSAENPVLILFGLTKPANSFFFFSYLVLFGSAASLMVFLKNLTHFGALKTKLTNALFVVSSMGACYLIWMYDLFPK